MINLIAFAPVGQYSNAQDVAAPGEAETGQISANDPTQQMRETVRRNSAALEETMRARAQARERTEQLAAQIETIRKDRASITAALIAAAKTEKKLSADITALEIQLTTLATREADLEKSLWERRAVLIEVIAALQRMGLNPPPAILVKPEDALSSVRSAILLSTVVPEMRAETAILLDDLRQLASVRANMTAETEKLSQTIALQADEQQRLALLVDEKRALEDQTAAALSAEQQRFAQLAEDAGNLEDLIGSIEAEIEAIEAEAERQRLVAEQLEREERERALAEIAAAEEAKRAELLAAEQARQEALKAIEDGRRRAEELAGRPNGFTPGKPFAQLRGQLARPVFGRTLTGFNDDDGLGSKTLGDTIETRSNAIVTAIADATVLYAGPFRAYGNVLIMDAGDDYHIVVAGLDQIDVTQGQFVIAGEPIGVMGSIKLASVSTAAAENNNPTLYIEFRKNGKSVDPAPWWASQEAGRT